MLEQAKKILKKYYGYDSFKPGQEKVIGSLLEGRDTLAVMPTGAGKSVCYQIPAAVFDGVTIVISPLISLMKDQVDVLDNLGLPATFINSSLKGSEVKNRLAQAAQGNYKLIYVAPERLETEDFVELLKGINVSFLAVDEAHCVSQWGHDFRPSYRKIGPFAEKLSKNILIGAFTATATEGITKDIGKFLNLKRPNVYVTGFDRANLSFAVLRGENKSRFVQDFLGEDRNKSGIIYTATRKEVDNLFETLVRKGIKCGRYHAGMTEKERTSAQEAFLKDDIAIIVATNAFGMGIDKSNVRFVIHNNMPKNMEAYYQEAGRAGRDGEYAECILLFSAHDIMLQKYLIEQTVFSPQRRTNEYKKLQQMVDYCHTSRCLRKYILEYFGEEEIKDNCGNCSNCSEDYDSADITVEAQKILSCVFRIKERFGATVVAEVLKGSQNKKVRQLGFNSLSTYGLMKDYTLQEIKDMINLLTAEGYLHLTEGGFPVLKLGTGAAAVLKQKEKVWQKKRKRKEMVRDDTLFEKLRILRKEIADRENIPPYIVFADSTLRELSALRPLDGESMLKVKGVGENKLARFGEEFLWVIRQHNTEEE
ncbi:DNA helicase RecQ [Candidatus Contubernalis alkaliaceticus]|uniref:DNA helicase RecQ n=1 Tax=Candidatus Contubernalis alkaliaceticus TaxID=338645 RepID=UPI001F4C00F3|nr:DNA helicase RecQ [Candidatus Contubernalis alkalaceticus]UNC91985.1 DNA helicase RecQ [Candidatus Contubernalis alkalaceticus]